MQAVVCLSGSLEAEDVHGTGANNHCLAVFIPGLWKTLNLLDKKLPSFILRGTELKPIGVIHCCSLGSEDNVAVGSKSQL